MVQKIKKQRLRQDSKAVEQKFAIHCHKEIQVPQHAVNTGSILDWPVSYCKEARHATGWYNLTARISNKSTPESSLKPLHTLLSAYNFTQVVFHFS